MFKRNSLQILIGCGFGTQSERGFLVGFNRIAVSEGWLLHLGEDVIYGLDHIRHSDAVVINGEEAERWVEQTMALKKAVIGIEVDLSRFHIPTVRIDNHQVGELAAKHLLGNGLRSFAVCSAHHPMNWSRLREDGFRAAIGDFPCGTWNSNHRPLPPAPRAQRKTELINWIHSLPKPVGIFCTTDYAAWDLANCCREVGIQIPEQVAMIGVDNDELVCVLTHPPLTSVAIPWERLGEECARMMVRVMHGEKDIESLVLPPSGVVVRQSSNMLAVPDRDVAAALNFIRDHASERFSVREILKSVPAHRHQLQRGFRKHLGRTMIQEIRRVHTELAKQLLTTTDLPMAEVAERSGFASPKKFSEEFRRETSIKPTLYRRRHRLGRNLTETAAI